MKLICKKNFETKIPAYFTIGKKYEFIIESKFEYSVTDDKKEVWLLSEIVVFNHFAFTYE